MATKRVYCLADVVKCSREVVPATVNDLSP